MNQHALSLVAFLSLAIVAVALFALPSTHKLVRVLIGLTTMLVFIWAVHSIGIKTGEQQSLYEIDPYFNGVLHKSQVIIDSLGRHRDLNEHLAARENTSFFSEFSETLDGALRGDGFDSGTDEAIIVRRERLDQAHQKLNEFIKKHKIVEFEPRPPMTPARTSPMYSNIIMRILLSIASFLIGFGLMWHFFKEIFPQEKNSDSLEFLSRGTALCLSGLFAVWVFNATEADQLISQVTKGLFGVIGSVIGILFLFITGYLAVKKLKATVSGKS
jgi:hypothetical protein